MLKSWGLRAIEKYRQLPATAKAGIWFAICGFIQKGISFITVPIYTRILTTDQYGVVSVFNSWEALLSILCTLNLFSGGFNNGMLDYKSRRNEYVSAVQGLITVITAAWAVLYVALRFIIEPLLGLPPIFVTAMFLQVLTTAALSLWSARERYEYRYKSPVVVTILNAILISVIPIPVILLSDPKYGAEIKILVHASVVFIICGGVYVYNLCRGKRFYSRDIWKTAFCFNLPLLPHYLSTMVLNQADRIMIEKMVGSAEAGIYSVAYSASMVLNILVSSINNAFAPWLYRRLEHKDYNGVAKVVNLLFAGVAIVLIMLIVLAPECIAILGGEEYAEAVMIIPSVTSSLYFIFMYQIYANVEFFYKKNKFIAYASVSGAVLNIILNYFGIKMFGFLAAGYTTLICYVLFGTAHFYFMNRICKKEMPGTDLFHSRTAFSIGAILVVTAMIMALLYSHPLVRYALLASIFMIIILNRNKMIRIFKTLKEQ